MTSRLPILTTTPVAAALLFASTAGACPLERLDWLAGAWISTTETRVVEEHWTPPAGGTLFAVNRTIADGSTRAWEWIRLECDDQGLPIYLASPGGRMPPTAFRLDAGASDLDRFLVFVNPEHDYPQRIEYALEAADHLVTRISGGLGTAVLGWEFRRAGGLRAEDLPESGAESPTEP